MATKKSATKKITAKASPAKKAASKKITAKKSPGKKAPSKKTAANKTALPKNKRIAKVDKPTPKSFMPPDAFNEIPDDADCICMQKKPGGKFYNFKLQEGRWVQASAIPFPTKDLCEDACC